jgi:hypothetical protein
MKMKFFLVAIMIIISGIICQNNANEWSDPASGTKYNFDSLKKTAE